MRPRQRLKKWIVAGLAVVCVVMLFNVISDIRESAGEAYHAQKPVAAPHARLQKAPARNPAKLRDLDPNLQVDTLKEYLSRPFPDVVRNPFDFGAVPVSPAGRASGDGVSIAPGGGPAVPQQPQVSIQAIGYSEPARVGSEAYVADEDQVYVVHKGDVVDKRYTILRITPTHVEVLDGASGETTQLSIPPAQ